MVDKNTFEREPESRIQFQTESEYTISPDGAKERLTFARERKETAISAFETR